MTPSSLACARFHLEYLAGPVLGLRWAESIAVTAGDVNILKARVRALALENCPPVLVDLNGMVTLSPGAFAELSTADGVPAVAVVGSSPVEKVLVAHFRAVHKPLYPVGYFEDRDEAHVWLHDQDYGTGTGSGCPEDSVAGPEPNNRQVNTTQAAGHRIAGNRDSAHRLPARHWFLPSPSVVCGGGARA